MLSAIGRVLIDPRHKHQCTDVREESNAHPTDGKLVCQPSPPKCHEPPWGERRDGATCLQPLVEGWQFHLLLRFLSMRHCGSYPTCIWFPCTELADRHVPGIRYPPYDDNRHVFPADPSQNLLTSVVAREVSAPVAPVFGKSSFDRASTTVSTLSCNPAVGAESRDSMTSIFHGRLSSNCISRPSHGSPTAPSCDLRGSEPATQHIHM